MTRRRPVYVLLCAQEYEGATLVGVFSSAEAARASVGGETVRRRGSRRSEPVWHGDDQEQLAWTRRPGETYEVFRCEVAG